MPGKEEEPQTPKLVDRTTTDERAALAAASAQAPEAKSENINAGAVPTDTPRGASNAHPGSGRK